nr:unnamed protein product [Callosobruchus chinensis]
MMQSREGQFNSSVTRP